MKQRAKLLGPFLYMKKNAVIIVLTCSASVSSNADVLSLMALPDYSTFHLKENGRLEVDERGKVNGATLAIAYEKENTLSMALSSKHQQGETDYQGFTQFGMPINTTVRYQFDEWSLAGAWQLNNQFSFTGALSDIEWQRNIQPSGRVLGLEETYQWQTLAFGVEIRWFLAKEVVFSVQGSALHIFNGTMTFNYPNYAGNPIKLIGINGRGDEVSLEYEKCMQNHCWSLNAGRQSYHLQSSDLQTIEINERRLEIIEPPTEWLIHSVGFGWRFNFNL